MIFQLISLEIQMVWNSLSVGCLFSPWILRELISKDAAVI